MFVVLSCAQDKNTDNMAVDRLINTVCEYNNYSLNLSRDANEFLLNVNSTNSEKYNSNLFKIGELYRLNNESVLNHQKLLELVDYYNQNARIDRKIEDVSIIKSNRIEYYLALRRIIKYGDHLPGTLNEPRLLLPYAINNNKFYAIKGDTIKVPIKAFIERDINQWRYELFDTLNFKTTEDNAGHFSIETRDKPIGASNEKLELFGKNIYTNKVEKVGTVEIELMINIE